MRSSCPSECDLGECEQGKCGATHCQEQEQGIQREIAAVFMESAMLAARAPFDLLIANILAGPLIDLAPAFSKALATGGTIILAGLLDSQAAAVAKAYQALGLNLIDRGTGEWPVVELQAP